MIIVTPISELFESKEEGELLAGLSNSLESRPDFPIEICSQHPVTHGHISDPALDVNLVWSETERCQIHRYLDSNLPSSTLSFHLARDYQTATMDNLGRYLPVGQAMTEDEMVSNAVENCDWISSQFGRRILIENNNYYNNGAYEAVGRPDFISRVVMETGAGFLFDYAHALVSAVNMGRSLNDYASGLPMHKVEQLHVSEPTVVSLEAVDSHGLPTAEMVQEAVSFVIGFGAAPPPVTVEYYKSAARLAGLLKGLRVENQRQPR